MQQEGLANATYARLLELRNEVQDSLAEWQRIVRKFNLPDDFDGSRLGVRNASAVDHSFSQ